MSLALVLPLLFSSPDSTVLPNPTMQPDSVVTEQSLCIDELSGKLGYCFTVRTDQAKIVLFVNQSGPRSLIIYKDSESYLIWKR